MVCEVVLCMSSYQPLQASSFRYRDASPQPSPRVSALRHTENTPWTAPMTVLEAT